MNHPKLDLLVRDILIHKSIVDYHNSNTNHKKNFQTVESSKRSYIMSYSKDERQMTISIINFYLINAYKLIR